MTIEAILERIAVALEKLAGNAPMPNLTAGAGQQAATEPKRGPGRPAAGDKQPDKPPVQTAPVPAAPADALQGKPAEPANNQQQAAPQAPKQAAEAAAQSVYEDIKKSANALALAKDRETVIAIFQQFGVSKGTELKPEQWADCLLKLKAAIKAAEQPADDPLA